MMPLDETYYAIFPYLRTSRAITIRGVELRSSTQLDGLCKNDTEAISSLSRLFHMPDGSPIGNVTWAAISSRDGRPSFGEIEAHLQQVQRLLAFLYNLPDQSGDPWLSAEHASVFLLRREKHVPLSWVKPRTNAAGEISALSGADMGLAPGYYGVRNWTCPFWVVDGSKIYPEFPDFYLNVPQDIASNLEELLEQDHWWAIRRLYLGQGYTDATTEERAFVSIRWYTASCRFAADEAEKLLSLAIALESLLGIREGDGLTQRFKDAVVTLLGPVPRLDSWLEQFYQQRSKIVHEGRPHSFAFLAADKQALKEAMRQPRGRSHSHGTLMGYGRRIFQLCFNAVLSGAALAGDARLATLFVPDRERLETIVAKLSQKGKSAGERLAEAADDMRNLGGWDSPRGGGTQAGIDLELLGTACRKVLEATLEAARGSPSELKTLVSEVAQYGKQFDLAQFERLERIGALLHAESPEQSLGLGPSAATGLAWIIEYATSVVIKHRLMETQLTKEGGGLLNTPGT